MFKVDKKDILSFTIEDMKKEMDTFPEHTNRNINLYKKAINETNDNELKEHFKLLLNTMETYIPKKETNMSFI